MVGKKLVLAKLGATGFGLAFCVGYVLEANKLIHLTVGNAALIPSLLFLLFGFVVTAGLLWAMWRYFK